MVLVFGVDCFQGEIAQFDTDRNYCGCTYGVTRVPRSERGR